MREPKARKPLVAAILSLFQPGLGHLYNGRPLIGLLAYLSLIVLVSLSAATMIGTFTGLVASLAVASLGYLGVAVHAATQARRLGNVQLAWFQRWYIYFVLVVGVQFVAGEAWSSFILPTMRYRAYKIPTGSMEPTLSIGDRFIVDTWAFRQRGPMPGEVMVHRYVQDPSRDMVHRCVAGPGDAIEIKRKRLFRNGQEVSEPYAVHLDPQDFSSVTSLDSIRNRDSFGPYALPPDSYFSLGDNRDNSYDSRFWGPVERTYLRAKPLYLYWSTDRTRIGKKVN